MILPTPIPFETERLILRPFEESDAESMFRWARDERVAHFCTWPAHENIDVTEAILRRWIDEGEPAWCIRWRSDPACIGAISVVNCRPEDDWAEIGYCLSRDEWGKGVAAEAAKGLCELLFTAFGAKVVAAKHDVDNPNSGRVMQKIGMRRLRTEPAYARNNLGLRDMVLYEVRREDWT